MRGRQRHPIDVYSGQASTAGSSRWFGRAGGVCNPPCRPSGQSRVSRSRRRSRLRRTIHPIRQGSGYSPGLWVRPGKGRCNLHLEPRARMRGSAVVFTYKLRKADAHESSLCRTATQSTFLRSRTASTLVVPRRTGQATSSRGQMYLDRVASERLRTPGDVQGWPIGTQRPLQRL